MLCNQCCQHMHREISVLEGKCVNLMGYGCDGGKCDFDLRKRLDEYVRKQVEKWRDERNRKKDEKDVNS